MHYGCGGNSRMLNPMCSLETAVMCGQPPPVQDGKVEGSDLRWGASVSYSCAQGFQLSHPAILSCEGRGVWKGEVPQCLRKSSGRTGSRSHLQITNMHTLGYSLRKRACVIYSHVTIGKNSSLRLHCPRADSVLFIICWFNSDT